MTTPRLRSLVSLIATMIVTACASAAPRTATMLPAPTLRFDNEARTAVHVYLVGEQREWLLGRVEPGARATLRLPMAALEDQAAFMRLAVLAGEHPSLSARHDPRSSFTIAQSSLWMLRQTWAFSQTAGTGMVNGLAIGRR